MLKLLSSFVRYASVLIVASASQFVCFAAAPQAERCVVLISVDGLAGFYLDDPRADMPTLRRLAREGARADGMVCSFPTVTWPNHTTLVTGVVPAKHGVIGNSFYDRAKQETVPFIPDPLFDKDEIVKAPTIYDVAHAAGLKTAAIVWPATRNAKTLDFTVPDMAGNEAWTQFGTRPWLDELRAEGIPVDHHGTWVGEKTGGVQRDWLYTRMAAQVLKRHAPNLLLIHLVETDHVQHRVGPQTDDAYWAVSYADDRVRDLVEAVEASPMRGKTTIFVCSDHGFMPVAKDIRPNVRLKQLGLVEMTGDKVTTRAVYCRPEGGACALYVLDDARRGELVDQLRKELAAIEGIDAVYGPEQFASIGQPTVADDPRAADLWLSCRSGYAFADAATGDDVVVAKAAPVGTHGYRPDQAALYGTCVVWGAGVSAGTKLGLMRNLDVAPTMAKLLGVELPNADGHALPGVGD
jgi:predicted AlkP superfamily pyrophosphatase or phosphodiesterase